MFHHLFISTAIKLNINKSSSEFKKSTALKWLDMFFKALYTHRVLLRFFPEICHTFSFRDARIKFNSFFIIFRSEIKTSFLSTVLNSVRLHSILAARDRITSIIYIYCKRITNFVIQLENYIIDVSPCSIL